jgi:hypothetical protein
MGDDALDERRQERFTAISGVVDELKEGEIARRFFLGDAAMRTRPGTRRRPTSLDRIDVDFVKAVAVFIARIFAASVTDSLVSISPCGKTSMDCRIRRCGSMFPWRRMFR